MTLVRNVFSAVIRDSGLSLGIDSAKDKDAQLKVVSSTLRKEASELTAGAAKAPRGRRGRGEARACEFFPPGPARAGRTSTSSTDP